MEECRQGVPGDRAGRDEFFFVIFVSIVIFVVQTRAIPDVYFQEACFP